MPPGVTDRPADVWEPLLAVADVAGGRWPIISRQACVELCKVAASREASLGVRLLGDLRMIFEDEDRLSTETILARLCALEESPWNNLRGRPLDARGLTRRLNAYGVSSTKVKINTDSLRGYRLEDLHDAWIRYLTPVPGSAELPEPTEPSTSDGTERVPLEDEVPEPAAQAEPRRPRDQHGSTGSAGSAGSAPLPQKRTPTPDERPRSSLRRARSGRGRAPVLGRLVLGEELDPALAEAALNVRRVFGPGVEEIA